MTHRGIPLILWTLGATALAQPSIPVDTSKCKRSALQDCRERAVMAIDNGSVAQKAVGLKMLDKACGWRDGDACELAGIVRLGHQDLGEGAAAALTWFDKGCEEDHAASCNRAAVLRSDDTREVYDLPAALAGFTQACTLGEPWGCHNAGDRYMLRDTPVYDVAKSQPLLERGCALDHAESCNKLGVLLAMHLEERARALEPIRKACELGDSQGCTNLWHLSDTPDKKHSLTRWQAAYRACTLGNAEGCDVIAYDGPLPGTWRVREVLLGGQAIDTAAWIGAQQSEDVPWGAEVWTFADATVTVSRYQGKRVSEEYWVGQVDTRVGWTRDGHNLNFSTAPAGVGSFTFPDGEDTVVAVVHGETAQIFAGYDLPSLACELGTDVCRRDIMLVLDKDTTLLLKPVLDVQNMLDEEVPWSR